MVSIVSISFHHSVHIVSIITVYILWSIFVSIFIRKLVSIGNHLAIFAVLHYKDTNEFRLTDTNSILSRFFFLHPGLPLPLRFSWMSSVFLTMWSSQPSKLTAHNRHLCHWSKHIFHWDRSWRPTWSLHLVLIPQHSKQHKKAMSKKLFIFQGKTNNNIFSRFLNPKCLVFLYDLIRRKNRICVNNYFIINRNNISRNDLNTLLMGICQVYRFAPFCAIFRRSHVDRI